MLTYTAAYALAFARLAPWQILMHGHTATSGIPTLDYFISYQVC
jgi:predicted O-linked N-acetylglucosamine transferase (SPINDLY family)